MNSVLAPRACASRSISMFAGKTAISSRITPIAAAVRVAGTSKPMAPRISNAPLTCTSRSGLGSQVGNQPGMIAR